MEDTNENEIKIYNPISYWVMFVVAVIFSGVAMMSDDAVVYIFFGIPAAIAYVLLAKCLIIEAVVEALEIFYGQEREIKK